MRLASARNTTIKAWGKDMGGTVAGAREIGEMYATARVIAGEGATDPTAETSGVTARACTIDSTAATKRHER